MKDYSQRVFRTILSVRLVDQSAQALVLPGRAVSVLAVRMLDGAPHLWFETDAPVEGAAGAPKDSANVYIVDTGATSPHIMDALYVGAIEDGGRVRHVYVFGVPVRR